MGRPINKKHMGNDAGSIKVSSYRRSGQSESQTAGFLVSQRSSTKFNVSCNGTEEVLTLVNKAQGALAEGEFIINAGDDSSTVKQVTKLMNRTVQLEGDEVAEWTTTDSGSDGKVYIAPTS
jgi:hypothetical protein